MNTLRKVNLLLIFSLLLSSCAIPPLDFLPAQAVALQEPVKQAEMTPLPNLVDVPPNATPTPTPFQPLLPTAIMTPTEIPTLTPFPTSTPAPLLPEPDLPVDPVTEATGTMNILLLGSDKRPWQTGFRTDTIVLVSLNPSKGTVSLLSFPRDLYVNIPGWTTDRINTAFYHGGFKLLAATMDANFGVRPTHYILINFRSFKQIVDSLGGLEVNVGTKLYDRYPGKGWITINKGRQKMNADMALWYVRSRKTTNDFARNKRQQEVVLALFEKFLSLDALKRVPEFYKLYKKSVSTDMTMTNGLAFLPLALQIAADPSRIKRYYINPQDVWDYITPGGAMVLLPRSDQIRKTVKQVLAGK
jgi:LCP family protein required for cell wall assembly